VCGISDTPVQGNRVNSGNRISVNRNRGRRTTGNRIQGNSLKINYIIMKFYNFLFL
jgi:hypothetical protein